MTRTARIARKTKESDVLVELSLDGTGQIDVATGVPFFDHMLSQLGKHWIGSSYFYLQVFSH